MDKKLGGLILCAVLTGCSASHVLVGQQRPPIAASDVQVYLEMPANAEQIALLNADSEMAPTFTSQQEVDWVMRRLKEGAAKLGANGIVLQQMGKEKGTATANTYNYGNGYSNTVISQSESQVASAIAIYVPR